MTELSACVAAPAPLFLRSTPLFWWTPLLGLIPLLGCGPDAPDPDDFSVTERSGAASSAEPCATRNPLRDAFFGDLHVHTALSSDAWSYDVEVRPRDAYAFAFGSPVGLPPRDAAGNPTRQAQIDRPLDFAAITDHAEFLGEQALCSDPSSEVYDAESCAAQRASTAPIDSPLAFKIMNPWATRDADVCGQDGERCIEAQRAPWQEIIDAAEEWNDTSAECLRTTFIAYEYSSHRLGSNLHRNVIFRNRVVPRRPVSYMDVRREWELWALLRETCLDSRTGCDVLAIPHNSNISNGRMFAVDYPGTSGVEEEAERAALRARLEPLVEVMQHKGDSECRPGVAGVLGRVDELCAWEKFEDMAFSRRGDRDPGECWEVPFADWIPHLGPDCVSAKSYVRYALAIGLAEEARLGVNPFKIGLLASTDTHNGLAGGVRERGWPGHLGNADGVQETRLSAEPGVMGNVANGPGGLVGVWAEENSRDAIFDALLRREVFGTSGPRIQPRFFAGWDYPADLCRDADWLARADRGGVPMGHDLPPRQGQASPSFVVHALRDPGTLDSPGAYLQRIQVIKAWVDDEGRIHEQVVDVAGGANGARVDPQTCEPEGAGAERLCGVWRDPDFDPSRRAVYYARVVENPSCRYSAWECSQLRGTPEAERPPDCADPFMSPIQQERAWTSPVWYTPSR